MNVVPLLERSSVSTSVSFYLQAILTIREHNWKKSAGQEALDSKHHLIREAADSDLRCINPFNYHFSFNFMAAFKCLVKNLTSKQKEIKTVVSTDV